MPPRAVGPLRHLMQRIDPVAFGGEADIVRPPEIRRV